MDNISLKRIQTLHPKFRQIAINGVGKINQIGLEIRIIQAARTFAYQDALYYQDKLPLQQVNALRMKVGLPLFTDSKQLVWASNAKGGESYHCFGCAFDFCLMHSDGMVSFDMHEDKNDDKNADWIEVVKIFQDMGCTWGAVFGDNDHIENGFGHTWQQLLDLYNAHKVDENGFVLI